MKVLKLNRVELELLKETLLHTINELNKLELDSKYQYDKEELRSRASELNKLLIKVCSI